MSFDVQPSAPSPALAGELAGFAATLAGSADIAQLERRYMEGARRFVPGRELGFYLLHPDSHAVRYVGATGVSDFFLARYEEAGRQVDPLLARTLDEARPVALETLMDRGAWLEHPMYTEVCRLHSFTRVLEAPVLAGGAVAGTLYFAGDDGAPATSVADMAIAESLGRLVGLAVAAIDGRAALERERDQAQAALELCDDAVAITDLRTGRRRLNPAAEAVLRRVAGGHDGSTLDDLMAQERALEGGGRLAQATVALQDGGQGTLRARSVTPDGEPATVVTFLSLDDGGAAGLPRLLERALTPRERDVAALVAMGLRDADIARRLVISPHTVNQHLKHIYAKLGVETRVELVRLALARRAGSQSHP